MRSAMRGEREFALPSGNLKLAADFGMQRRRAARRSPSQAANQSRDAQKARPPEGLRLRIIMQRREMLLAEREQFARADRPAGRPAKSAVKSPMAPWMTVPRSRAPGGVSTGIERRQPQHMLGVDRVGIAQPVLDVGDGEPRRPRRERRRRRRARGGFDFCRMVERAGASEIVSPRAQHVLPARRRRARRCVARSATPPSARRRAWRRA